MALTRTSRNTGVGALIEVRDIGGNLSRQGEILEVLGRPGHDHYRVRWSDGHESIHYPAAGTRVLPVRASGSQP